MAFMESSMTAFMAAEETSVKTQSNLPTSQQPISHHRPQVTLTQKSYPYKCQLDPIKKKTKNKKPQPPEVLPAPSFASFEGTI